MADTKISALTELTSLATDDEFVVVDKSDTTMAASGTNKRVKKSTLDGIYQPLDSDLSALAALTTTVFGRALLESADAAAVRTAISAAAASHTHAQADVTNLTTDLAAKAPLASPALTGNPTAPTPSPGDNDTSIATTAFVADAVSGAGGLPPEGPDGDLLGVVAGAWASVTPDTDVDAVDIDFTPAGTIAATNTQAAVEEVATDAAAALTAHTGDTSDAHDASAISFSPTGTIAATDVQAAIAEVAAEGGGGGGGVDQSGVYQLIHRTSGRITVSGLTSTDYILLPNTSDQAEGTAINAASFNQPFSFWVKASEYTLSGKTPKFKLRVVCSGPTALTNNITFALGRLTLSGGTTAVGAAETGSDFTVTTPPANAPTMSESSDFDVPSTEGLYVVRYTLSGVPNATLQVAASVFLHWV